MGMVQSRSCQSSPLVASLNQRHAAAATQGVSDSRSQDLHGERRGGRRGGRPSSRRGRGGAKLRGEDPLKLIQGSLSPRRVERQAPWLSALHRVTDGTLAGLGCCMLALSALTLHWQGEWGQSFQRLEDAQVLTHRLQESGAVLEQHHLGVARRPGWLVPTSSEKLIYLRAPGAATVPPAPPLLAGIQLRQIPIGY